MKPGLKARYRDVFDFATAALFERPSPVPAWEIEEGLIVLCPVKALFGIDAHVIFQPGRKWRCSKFCNTQGKATILGGIASLISSSARNRHAQAMAALGLSEFL